MSDVRSLLARIGAAVQPAQELARSLGVSRATLSRLVAAAGPRVVRVGKTRSTRYALTRQVRGVDGPIPLRRISPEGTPAPFASLRALAGGRHLLLRGSAEVVFEGIPPFLEDMRPQGFLGRRFAERNPELELPARLQDWSADDVLWGLMQRGEDTVGDLILGDASFDRWLAQVPEVARREQYPQLAHQVAQHGAGSSAGGEHPKFAVWTGERHLLVKYAGGVDGGAAVVRWRDLLVCEAIALRILREAGLQGCRAEWVDVEGMRFLEVERFDRRGPRGRLGVVSLGAWDNEYLGTHRTWTSAAAEMESLGQLSAEDTRRIRWLDTFGELIANTDRHFWNLSFFWDAEGLPTLAPSYDMLPMQFAPGPQGLVERPFTPKPPTAANLDVWAEAASWAARFWQEVADSEAISRSVRELAEESNKDIGVLRARFAGTAT